LAVGLSALVVLASTAAATLRHVLPEVLRHVQQVQQQRDRYHEAILRESDQHAEAVLLLDTVTSAVDGVEVARAICGMRRTTGADG
jgi:hypothetical protein